MAQQYSPAISARAAQLSGLDQGLRAYMLRIYNYMAGALGLSGLTAYFVSTQPQLLASLGGGGMFVLALATVGLVFYLSFRIQSLSFSTARMLFWIYAALMGVTLAPLLLVYTGESVVRTFLISAALFLTMSLYGYTTKRDLTAFGSFLFMGVIGLILASVVNIFLASSTMQFIISAVGVLLFTGLTAYDTQRIKEVYVASDASDTMGKKALMGALTLYLDAVNLFIYLLRFIGERR